MGRKKIKGSLDTAGHLSNEHQYAMSTIADLHTSIITALAAGETPDGKDVARLQEWHNYKASIASAQTIAAAKGMPIIPQRP